MVGVNNVLLVGNLGADPEVRQTSSGTSVANLRLAINEKRKDGDQWVDHTEWMGVSVFGRNAENAGQYLTKGSQVLVEGKLQTKKFTDKDGNDRSITEVLCSKLLFLGARGGASSASAGDGTGAGRSRSTSAHAKRQATNSARVDDAEFVDDDLPF
jgi:single-strand DNA-binding protein